MRPKLILACLLLFFAAHAMSAQQVEDPPAMGCEPSHMITPGQPSKHDANGDNTKDYCHGKKLDDGTCVMYTWDSKKTEVNCKTMQAPNGSPPYSACHAKMMCGGVQVMCGGQDVQAWAGIARSGSNAGQRYIGCQGPNQSPIYNYCP